MFRMIRLTLFALSMLLVCAVADVSAAKADKAAKKKTDAPPPGYSKVTSLDLEKKTINLFGDDTQYRYTDKTTNYDRVSIGAFVKFTLKENSKTDVVSIDIAPATTKKKKDKNN